MDAVTKQDLELLTQERKGICVSLYLRAHPSRPEQDSMNLNNMLAAVQAELTALGMDQHGVRSFIRPARALLSDTAFWQVPGRGLALFLADGFFRSYRMPIAFDDTLVAADRFLLAPLLPLLTGETDHYLLVLSQSKIRLFQGNRFGLDKVMVPGVPAGVMEAVSQEQNEAYQHSPMRPVKGVARVERRDDANISQYFPALNKGIHELLLDRDLPLVIAGVDYLLPLYRQANTYPGLVPVEITGDLDGLRAEALHQKAWPLIDPLVRARRAEALEELQGAMGTKKATTSLPEIVAASYKGNVSTLYVSGRKHEWGIVDRFRGGMVTRTAGREEKGSEDLYDLAALCTLLKGGKVFIVEGSSVTEGVAIAAMLRP
jgi:hypothetical protein